jgi:hypothetical protein
MTAIGVADPKKTVAREAAAMLEVEPAQGRHDQRDCSAGKQPVLPPRARCSTVLQREALDAPTHGVRPMTPEAPLGQAFRAARALRGW